MSIGGLNTSLFQGEINWVARTGDRGYWAIPLRNVNINGNSLEGMIASEAVIDSGTSLLAGPPADVARIYAQIDGSRPVVLDGQGGFYSCRSISLYLGGCILD